MTGYGQAERPWSERSAALRVELRSVNSRFLELKSRHPFDVAIDHELRRRVEGSLGRGRVDLFVRLDGAEGAGGDEPLQALGVEPARIEQALRALQLLTDQAHQASYQVAHPTSLDLLRFLISSRSASGASSGPEAAPDFLLEVVDEAVARLVAMREQEGAALAAVLAGLYDELEAQVAAMATSIEGEGDRLHRRMLERLDTILTRQGAGEIDRERVAQEVAVLLARGDVNEELARVASHLAQARAVLAAPAEVGQGKVLDFLGQELLREVTTIGSKITSHQGSATVIEAKRTIERLREQVQNVE